VRKPTVFELSLAATGGALLTFLMQIKPEFESQLVLRNVREFVASKRKFEECISENMKEGREYGFLVDGQRNYWLFGEFPLYEMREDGLVNENHRALINIFEVTQFIEKGHVFTSGKYKVLTVIGL
jgi:hypothetical protein